MLYNYVTSVNTKTASDNGGFSLVCYQQLPKRRPKPMYFLLPIMGNH